MAAVTVFVDDAVLGRLPYLCVKTGAPAEGLLTIHTPVQGGTGLGVWWLLILAGPLGWVGLLFIAMSQGNGDMLTVQVPWTEAAQHELDRAKERRRNRWLACVALVGLAAVLAGIGGDVAVVGEMAGVLLFVAALVGLTALGASLAVNRASVDVRLDASRRWVALGDIHRDFVHAVETSRSGHQPAAP